MVFMVAAWTGSYRTAALPCSLQHGPLDSIQYGTSTTAEQDPNCLKAFTCMLSTTTEPTPELEPQMKHLPSCSFVSVF